MSVSIIFLKLTSLNQFFRNLPHLSLTIASLVNFLRHHKDKVANCRPQHHRQKQINVEGHRHQHQAIINCRLQKRPNGPLHLVLAEEKMAGRVAAAFGGTTVGFDFFEHDA